MLTDTKRPYVIMKRTVFFFCFHYFISESISYQMAAFASIQAAAA